MSEQEKTTSTPTLSDESSRVDYVAWQADKAKIAELEAQVRHLTFASEERKRQRREDHEKLSGQFKEHMATWEAEKLNQANARAENAKHEAAKWKKKYHDRLAAEIKGACGISLALREANEKLVENQKIVDFLLEELVKARGAAVGGPSSSLSDVIGSSLSSVALDSRAPSMFEHHSGFYAAGLPSGGSRPPTANDDTTPLPLLETELELVSTRHQVEQANSIAAREKTKHIDTAAQLSAALSEIVDLRSQLKQLTEQLTTESKTRGEAHHKLWQERMLAFPLTNEISQTNHRLQKLLEEAKKLLDRVVGYPKYELDLEGINMDLSDENSLGPMGMELYGRCRRAYLALTKLGRYFTAVVAETEDYLRTVRSNRLTWDSDDDEVDADMEDDDGDEADTDMEDDDEDDEEENDGV